MYEIVDFMQCFNSYSFSIPLFNVIYHTICIASYRTCFQVMRKLPHMYSHVLCIAESYQGRTIITKDKKYIITIEIPYYVTYYVQDRHLDVPNF